LKKLLLYRRGGLGDTLLTFPLLEIFKWQGFHITTVGNTDYFEIAKEVGWVDRVLSEMPKEDFDKRIIIGTDGIDPFPKERVWVLEYYLKLLGLPSHYSQTLPLDADSNSPFKGKVVLHPSSSSPKKNPPIKLFFEIENFLTSLGYQCVYLVGEADQWLKVHVKNFVEMYQPLQIAKALKSALFFVGNDSGLSHLSAYLGLPTFVFYGPTDPVVWKPIGKSVFQISLNLSCSPCFPNTCQERVCFDISALFERFLDYFKGMSL